MRAGRSPSGKWLPSLVEHTGLNRYETSFCSIYIEANPGDTRTLAELAREANTTERTLMRRCQRDWGMSLAEWRQRLRIVKAMVRLEAGQTFENSALD